jgi:hypothetical protein
MEVWREIGVHWLVFTLEIVNVFSVSLTAIKAWQAWWEEVMSLARHYAAFRL